MPGSLDLPAEPPDFDGIGVALRVGEPLGSSFCLPGSLDLPAEPPDFDGIGVEVLSPDFLAPESCPPGVARPGVCSGLPGVDAPDGVVFGRGVVVDPGS